MANVNKPFGFRLHDTGGKDAYVRLYRKGTATAIFRGDTVKRHADGYVVINTTGAPVVGVAAEYRAASATDILVYDDPSYIYETMALGDFQLADIFQNADIDATSGDTGLLNSKQSIAMSTKDTTATLQFTLLGLSPDPEAVVGSFAKILVRVNSAYTKAGVAGL